MLRTAQAFLKAGEPPIYLGWGSMCRKNNPDLCRAAVGACKIAGKRGIVLGGWAKLNIGMLEEEKDAELLAYCRTGANGKPAIFFTEKANHIKHAQRDANPPPPGPRPPASLPAHPTRTRRFTARISPQALPRVRGRA